jgi:phosphohistidine phosphatase
MRIVLFRHGPAEARDAERWPDDSQRPLTKHGVDVTRRAARGVARMEPRIARVVSSPAVRALDTARLLSSALDLGTEPDLLAALAPEGAWRDALPWLAEQPADASPGPRGAPARAWTCSRASCCG